MKNYNKNVINFYLSESKTDIIRKMAKNSQLSQGQFCKWIVEKYIEAIIEAGINETINSENS